MKTTDTDRRPATIIINERGEKGMIGKAIRKALKINKWGGEKHSVSYLTKREAMTYGRGYASFYLFVTDAEMASVNAACTEIMGWIPEAYHD